MKQYIVIALGFLLVPQANAQPNLAAVWTFNDGDANSMTGVSTPSYVNPLLLASASLVYPGTGIANVGYTQGASLVSTDNGKWADHWTFNLSPDTADYFWFYITAPMWYTMAFDSIVYQERASGTGPQNWQLKTSYDAYGSTVALGPTKIAASSSTPWGKRVIIAGLQPFSNTRGVRIYGYAATGTGGSWRIDNIKVYLHVQSTTLPIELLSFTGEARERDVRLDWSTATETNNDYFTIEKSLDGVSWQSIGTVPGAGTSLSAREYDLLDRFPVVGLNYYRLSQTDYDGTHVIVRTIAVEWTIDDGLTWIIDISGREVRGLSATHDLTDLPAGMYFAHSKYCPPRTIVIR